MTTGPNTGAFGAEPVSVRRKTLRETGAAILRSKKFQNKNAFRVTPGKFAADWTPCDPKTEPRGAPQPGSANCPERS